MIVGAQYQFNKRYQLRTEAGVVGDRKFLLSLNYRFLNRSRFKETYFLIVFSFIF